MRTFGGFLWCQSSLSFLVMSLRLHQKAGWDFSSATPCACRNSILYTRPVYRPRASLMSRVYQPTQINRVSQMVRVVPKFCSSHTHHSVPKILAPFFLKQHSKVFFTAMRGEMPFHCFTQWPVAKPGSWIRDWCMRANLTKKKIKLSPRGWLFEAQQETSEGFYEYL